MICAKVGRVHESRGLSGVAGAARTHARGGREGARRPQVDVEALWRWVDKDPATILSETGAKEGQELRELRSLTNGRPPGPMTALSRGKAYRSVTFARIEEQGLEAFVD